MKRSKVLMGKKSEWKKEYVAYLGLKTLFE